MYIYTQNIAARERGGGGGGGDGRRGGFHGIIAVLLLSGAHARKGPPARPAATESGMSRGSFATVMRTAGRSIRRRRSTAVRAARVGSPVRDDTRKRTRRLSREGRAHHRAPTTFSAFRESRAYAASSYLLCIYVSVFSILRRAHANAAATVRPLPNSRFLCDLLHGPSPEV